MEIYEELIAERARIRIFRNVHIVLGVLNAGFAIYLHNIGLAFFALFGGVAATVEHLAVLPQLERDIDRFRKKLECDWGIFL